jgi:hypothetical protein
LRPNAVEAIKALEPYNGGRGSILWELNQIDIVDKHHLLLAVGGINPSHTMPPGDIASYKHALGIEDGLFTATQEAVFFQRVPSVAKFPLKAGDELCRAPMAEADKKMYFPFVVAFGEPEIVKGKPVVPTLQQMADFIRNMVRDFDKRGILCR